MQSDVVDTMRTLFESDDSWKTFENLNRRFIQESMYISDKYLQYITKVITEAGVEPSYTMLKALSHSGYLEANRKDFIVKAIKLSPTFAQKKGRTQAQLATGMSNFLNVSAGGDPGGKLIQKTLSDKSFPANIEEWDSLMEEVVEIGNSKYYSLQSEPRRRRRKRQVSAEVKKRARAARFKDVEPMLTEDVLTRITKIARVTSASLMEIYDKSITLRDYDGNREFLSLYKDDELIDVSPTHWMEFKFFDKPGLSSWGYGSAIFAAVAHEVITENWNLEDEGIKMPDRTSFIRWLPNLKPLLPEMAGLLDDEILSERVTDAMEKIITKKTKDIADRSLGRYIDDASRDARPTLGQYLVAAKLGETLETLSETNPIVAFWCLFHAATSSRLRDIRHPGQVVSLVRGVYQTNGFDLRNWKTLSKLDAKVVGTILCHKAEPREQMVMLNALCEARVNPHPALLKGILGRMYLPSSKILTLLFRESASILKRNPKDQQVELFHQYSNVADYGRAMEAEGREIHSKKWSGLLKKSERWHRELRQRREMNRWQDIIRRNNGCYRKWNSAIDVRTYDDWKFVALSSEKELLEEAVAMKHCLSSYGDQCSDGRARIFRVLYQDEHVGTAEIVNYTDIWNRSQVNGMYNARLSEEAQLLTDDLAIEYTKAWKSMSEQDRLEVRMIPANTEDFDYQAQAA